MASEWNYKHTEGAQETENYDFLVFVPVSMQSLDERYEMIKQSQRILFGKNLGEIFSKITCLYYGERKDEIKKCLDYEQYLIETLYGVQQGPPEMTIFVRTLTCKTLAIDMNENDFIYLLKQRVEDREGIPVSQQRMIFAGNYVLNFQKLKDYNIQKMSWLQLLIPVV